MLYKFKSRATADVIMLEANGRQLVQIMGKTPGQGGIVTVEQIPGAIAASPNTPTVVPEAEPAQTLEAPSADLNEALERRLNLTAEEAELIAHTAAALVASVQGQRPRS